MPSQAPAIDIATVLPQGSAPRAAVAALANTMMFGAGSMAASWEAPASPWSGGDDHYDQHNYDDPNTYWDKGNRITRPGNHHAPGRSDPFGHSTTKIPPYWEPGDERR